MSGATTPTPVSAAVNPSKRPFEESSPAENEAPNAKRPALQKGADTSPSPSNPASPVPNMQTDAEKPAVEETADDKLPIATDKNGVTADVGEEVKVIGAAEKSTTKGPLTNGNGTKPEPIQTEIPASQGPQTATSIATIASPSSSQAQNEAAWIHVRAVIASAEAATIIGKAGENVTSIRKLSGARCTVSDYVRGAIERILTVSGPVDAVAKAFGLIVRTVNGEAMEQPSSVASKPYHMRLLVPHILVGSIIGHKGTTIREIQEASGARLNVSEQPMPLSSERSLTMLGVADSIHIASFWVATALAKVYNERYGGPSASAYASRNGGPAGSAPGGLQVMPYVPQAVGGIYGHPDNYRRNPAQSQRGPPQAAAYAQGYIPQQAQLTPQPTMHYPQHVPMPQSPYSGAGPHQPHMAPHHPAMSSQPHPSHVGPPQQPVQAMMPGGGVTQQIFIPNDMVGAIIGKGGAKINEIRQLSGSMIKINEPQDNSNERLVTITGSAECNQMALYMLYSRLGEYPKNGRDAMRT